jgi:hypothetical protein
MPCCTHSNYISEVSRQRASICSPDMILPFIKSGVPVLILILEVLNVISCTVEGSTHCLHNSGLIQPYDFSSSWQHRSQSPAQIFL